MKISTRQLEGHLKREMAPLYAVHGGEALLALEAADRIREGARKSGCTEREQRLGAVHRVERGHFLLQMAFELACRDLQVQSSRFTAATWCRIWRARSSCMSL